MNKGQVSLSTNVHKGVHVLHGADESIDPSNGAAETLRTQRPVIFCEVADVRTHPWGYPASEILKYLSQTDYGILDAAGDVDLTGSLENLNLNVIASHE